MPNRQIQRSDLMKNFKDFFYDKNDILIAVVILAIAVGLIWWRLSVIMDYPETLLVEPEGTQTTEPSYPDTSAQKPAAPSTPDTQGGAQGGSEADGGSTTVGDVYENGALTQDITVRVAGGSATAAVQCLVDVGLFDSYSDFETVCENAGHDPLDIKASTFTFNIGDSKADIAYKVTR